MASRAAAVNFSEQDVHKPELLVSQHAIREAQRKALNLHVGKGRRFSVNDAAQGSGVPERAIEAAKTVITDENYRPLNQENLASLAKFLGPSFVSTYLELSDLGAYEIGEEQPLPRMLEPCKSPDKLTRDEHIRKAFEHIAAAQVME